MSNLALRKKEPVPPLFSHDELVLIAHYRMSCYSIASALKAIQRQEVEEATLTRFINSRYKGSTGFFAAFAKEVHEKRAGGSLPVIAPPKKRTRTDAEKARWFTMTNNKN